LQDGEDKGKLFLQQTNSNNKSNLVFQSGFITIPYLAAKLGSSFQLSDCHRYGQSPILQHSYYDLLLNKIQNEYKWWLR